MRNYTPRRQSKRWLDTDCPAGVLAIYDNRGKTADRYTVFYAEIISPRFGDAFATGSLQTEAWIGYRAMSENPSSAQGVGIYSEIPAYQVANYRYRFRHQACQWSSLPDAVKQCVRQDLKPV